MHIRLKISNVNDVKYEKIILRKFFNMVFFSEDGKKLTVYTATVFGGMHGAGEIKDRKFVPAYCAESECILNFQYEIDGDEDQPSIKFDDLTKSFFEQTEYVGKVWGTCEKITSQTKLQERLQQLYPDLEDLNINMDAGLSYYVAEQGKAASHEFIATQGKFNIDAEDGKNSYTLQSNAGGHNGLEYMNWVKSEISLSKSIFNKCFKFEIILNHNGKSVYYTPDFTWYFAPPNGYRVDKETAEVDIGDEKGIRNYVQSVADGTTVYFREWETTELIAERKKVRVDLKEYTNAQESRKLSDKGNITAKITVNNPDRGTNKQFFVGLLVAFLLAFCADKTRMNDFYACLQESCNCIQIEGIHKCYCQNFCNLFSLFFPIIVLLAYVSWVFKLKPCVPVKRNKAYYMWYVVKVLGISMTIFLIIYTFGLWMVAGPEFMRKVIPTCAGNWCIIAVLAVFSFILNLAYIIFCTKFRKKKFFDNL